MTHSDHINWLPLLTWQHIYPYYQRQPHAVLSTLHIRMFCSLCSQTAHEVEDFTLQWHAVLRLLCSSRGPILHVYVCCIIVYADGCCWLRYWLMTHSLLNLLEVLQSRRQSPPVWPTPERLPFPYIRGCTCLNWDSLCCDSIFTGWKMAGQVCKTFSRLPPPASVCWPKCLRSW